jgi:2-succinyl-5-enolpyruvyl-6-hydroxy-3-cyclohexene-1-carboxylate synthase
LALLKHIFKLSELCSSLGLKEVIICPGSRSAALTLAFNRNPALETQVVADERSAAFLALGKASIANIPTGLVCTSGSAAYNFSPAVAEAFFQEIPLLIFTADRPPEWIHQYDGQTIFQENMYGKHVKKSYCLPTDYTHSDAEWAMKRIINEAYGLSMTEPKGPVHINVPIREPFYPTKGEEYTFGKEKIKSVLYSKNIQKLDAATWQEIASIWQKAEKPMIAIGQQASLELGKFLQKFENKAVVISDSISNAQLAFGIKNQDLICSQLTNMHPDLLITAGKSFISKAFKNYIRQSEIKYHIHVQEHPDVIDPFQKLSHKLSVSAEYFFEILSEIKLDTLKNKEYIKTWQEADKQATEYLVSKVENSEWGQLLAIKTALEFSSSEVIHVGNSMPVRYLNYLQNYIRANTLVMANRGTSGIDGILSTAIGQADSSNKDTLCIIGDVSFFYDSNALFLDPLPSNISVLVINNAGGNIFRQIDGPANTAELESHFVGKQVRTAKNLSEEAGVGYFVARDNISLKEAIKAKSPKVIEAFVDGETDVMILKNLISNFKI